MTATDWLIHRTQSNPSNWPKRRPAERLTQRTDRRTDWLRADRLTDWPTDDWLTDWLTDRPTDRLTNQRNIKLLIPGKVKPKNKSTYWESWSAWQIVHRVEAACSSLEDRSVHVSQGEDIHSHEVAYGREQTLGSLSSTFRRSPPGVGDIFFKSKYKASTNTDKKKEENWERWIFEIPSFLILR